MACGKRQLDSVSSLPAQMKKQIIEQLAKGAAECSPTPNESLISD